MSNIVNKLLETKRPISQLELKSIRNTLHNNLNLSTKYAIHDNCKHFYLVKKFGKKIKQITKQEEIKNCTLCWNYKNNKINNMNHLIDDYGNYFENEALFNESDLYLTKNMLITEFDFYNWVYKKN